MNTELCQVFTHFFYLLKVVLFVRKVVKKVLIETSYLKQGFPSIHLYACLHTFPRIFPIIQISLQ